MSTQWRRALLSVVARFSPGDDQCSEVRYQDECGRRATAVVRAVEGGVRLEGSGFQPMHLSVAQAGRLREALRAAVFDLDRLDEGDPAPVRAVEIPGQRSKSITREGDADTYCLG